VIGSVAARSAFSAASQISNKPDARPAPKAPPTPTRAPSGVLGQGGEEKPGHKGGTGTSGPAPGIQSPARVQIQPSGQSPNLRANADGTIQYAAGARGSSKLTITQRTVEPTSPLKTRAEAMRGTHVDARG
jgi:hypothetical protein